MAKGVKLSDLTDSGEVMPYINKLHNETHRACAIIAVVILDGLLEQLLRKKMISNAPDEIFSSGYGPLNTFSAKIDTAFSLGLLSQNERDELQRVNRIRNKFAHSLDLNLSFSKSPVRELVAKLFLPRNPEHTMKWGRRQSPARVNFETSVFVLCAVLLAKIREVRRPKRLPDYLARVSHTS